MAEPISRQDLVLQLLDTNEKASARARAAAALADLETDRFIICTAVPALDAASAEDHDGAVRAAARAARDKIIGEFNDSAAVRQQVIESFGKSPSFDAGRFSAHPQFEQMPQCG